MSMDVLLVTFSLQMAVAAFFILIYGVQTNSNQQQISFAANHCQMPENSTNWPAQESALPATMSAWFSRASTAGDFLLVALREKARHYKLLTYYRNLVVGLVSNLALERSLKTRRRGGV
jgi:hypothetical protein